MWRTREISFFFIFRGKARHLWSWRKFLCTNTHTHWNFRCTCRGENISLRKLKNILKKKRIIIYGRTYFVSIRISMFMLACLIQTYIDRGYLEVYICLYVFFCIMISWGSLLQFSSKNYYYCLHAMCVWALWDEKNFCLLLLDSMLVCSWLSEETRENECTILSCMNVAINFLDDQKTTFFSEARSALSDSQHLFCSLMLDLTRFLSCSLKKFSWSGFPRKKN